MRRKATISTLAIVSVSIHAPVKDATDEQVPKDKVTDVSIHAPVKDATI